MINNNILQIIEKGENETTEFKTAFGKAVIECLVAFANTKGGRVIIGCNDKGEIIGTTVNEESIQNWVNEIKQKTEPSLTPQIESSVFDNKTVVIFIIPEYPVKPVAVQGRYYTRKHNSNHLLSADEIVELRINNLNLSFDAFKVSTLFAQLDTKALGHFKKLVNEAGRYNPSNKLKSDFIKLGFINDNNLTRAAELLFGLHHTAIHLGRFKSPTTIIV